MAETKAIASARLEEEDDNECINIAHALQGMWPAIATTTRP
jgi:hypothetical protein